jgi:hypothetical protein
MGSGCIDPHFLDLGTIVGGERSASRPGRYTPGERVPGTHWVGGWVDPRTGLDMEKGKFLTLSGLEHRPLGRAVAIATALSRLLPVIIHVVHNSQT